MFNKRSNSITALATFIIINSATVVGCGREEAPVHRGPDSQGVVVGKTNTDSMKGDGVNAGGAVQAPVAKTEGSKGTTQASTETIKASSPLQAPCATGHVCFKGDRSEYPVLDANGEEFDRDVLESCITTFRGRGKIVDGSMPITQATANLGILSGAHFEDYSAGRKLMLVENVNVLAGSSFELGNPDALYCVRNFNFLGGVSVKGCHAANVVILENVQVLAGLSVEQLACK